MSSAPRQREPGAGRDVNVCALSPPTVTTEGSAPMNRFVAPLSFTMAAAWVLVLFVLVHNTP
jgi:hypothetical protein